MIVITAKSNIGQDNLFSLDIILNILVMLNLLILLNFGNMQQGCLPDTTVNRGVNLN